MNMHPIIKDLWTCFTISVLGVFLIVLSSAYLSNLYDWLDSPRNQLTIVIFFMLALACLGFVLMVKFIKRKL